MTPQLFLNAPIHMPTHVADVTAALLVGTWLIYFSHKGAPGRRLAGATRLALIAAARAAPLAVRRAMDSIRRCCFAIRGPLLGGLVMSAAINILVLHGVARDVVFPTPPASTHAGLFPLVTIDLGADR